MIDQYNFTDAEFCKHEAKGIWEYVNEVLDNSELLLDYGFVRRSDVKMNIIVLTVGDKLHPAKGLDYLGSNWEKLSDRECLHLLSARSNAVESIQRSVLSTLSNFGYEAARHQAEKISKHQVVFLSSSESETVDTLQSMLEVGVGVHEFSGGVIQRSGDSLVHAFREHYSYFIKS